MLYDWGCFDIYTHGRCRRTIRVKLKNSPGGIVWGSTYNTHHRGSHQGIPEYQHRHLLASASSLVSVISRHSPDLHQQHPTSFSITSMTHHITTRTQTPHRSVTPPFATDTNNSIMAISGVLVMRSTLRATRFTGI